MANFRRGAEAAEAAKSSGGNRFTPTHTWKKPGDEHFLQLITSADEILTVLYHNFIIVGETDDGKNIYRDFISPTDEAIDGPSGYDPLTERFGVRPKTYNVALAVAMDPIMDGKKVVDFEVQMREYEKDGETVQVPNVALVMQSVFADLFPWLFGYADTQGPIEDRVFQIKQSGKGKDKRLNVFDAGEAIELDDDVIEAFDYIEHLEKLADPARYAEYIDPLPDDAVVTMYGGKDDSKGSKKTSSKSSKKKTTKKSGGKSTTSKSRSKGEDSSDDGEDTPTRSTRFTRLKQKVEN